MIETLVNHYTDGNKAQFAKNVGISPQTLSKWIGRKTFDAELLYKKCVGLSGDWLLSGGEGEMFRTANIISADNGGIAAGGDIHGSTAIGVGSISTVTNNNEGGCRDDESTPILQTLTESVSTLVKELETSQDQKSRLIGIIEKLTDK